MKSPKIMKIRGPKSGYCSICAEYGVLTFDHIPPKGTITIRPVEIRSLSQDKKTKAIISQNGVKFRTICKRCNNDLLGRLYDPELIKFTNDVSVFLRARVDSNLCFPPKQKFEVKPQKLLRSIIGHILAGFINKGPENKPVKALFTSALREYFLDNTKSIPKKLKVYYWPYPSQNQVLMRGFYIMSPSKFNGAISGDLLKFFPIAYWLVWDLPKNIQINRPELSPSKNLSLEDKEEVAIDFKSIPKENWPENPGDDGIILTCDERTIYSVSRKKNKI